MSRAEFIRAMRLLHVVALCGVAATSLFAAGKPRDLTLEQTTEKKDARPVTVEDTIDMTEFVTFEAGLPKGAAVVFSPDGQHFAVTIQRGDRERNERVFSILVFETNQVFDRPAAETVAVIHSGTNDPGIVDVRWLNNRVLTFLGSSGSGPAQVFSADITAHTLRQLTTHPTKVIGYAVSPTFDRIIFSAEQDTRALKKHNETHGFTVINQSLTDLLRGYSFLPDGRGAGDDDLGIGQIPETFVETISTGQVIPVKFPGGEAVRVPEGSYKFSPNPISPDGRMALVEGIERANPLWLQFSSPFPHHSASRRWLPTFAVVDLTTAITTRLLDAPSLGWALGSALWSPDCRSIIIANTFLPLEGSHGETREARLHQTVVAELDLATRQVMPIQGPTLRSATADGAICARPVAWTKVPERLTLTMSGSPYNRGGFCDGNLLVTYERYGDGWRETDVQSAKPFLTQAPNSHIAVSIAQDLNTPPVLQGRDIKTARTAVIFDPNPQFLELQFATVKLLEWTATDGVKWSGTFYSPLGLSQGTRPPLVIQTHGCKTDEFQINGEDTTGYAAQVLAGQGIAVLQMGQCANPGQRRSFADYTPAYGEWQLRGFESAVDMLDHQGLIDRTRVGLEGWSVTGWSVAYALAHPKAGYRYAAALASSWSDGGYFNYIAASEWRKTIEEGAGGPPIGPTVDAFHRNALPYSLNRVVAPILMQEADQTEWLPYLWESYSVLKLLNRPVELIVFPDGSHDLVKPWERQTSQQSAVDWFRFWLKEEEDPDPSKAEQYARWRELRQLEHTAERNLQNATLVAPVQ